MYDWIIEADIYRYRKELVGLDDGPQRQRLLARLKEAEAILSRRQFGELIRESSHA